MCKAPESCRLSEVLDIQAHLALYRYFADSSNPLSLINDDDNEKCAGSGLSDSESEPGLVLSSSP